MGLAGEEHLERTYSKALAEYVYRHMYIQLCTCVCACVLMHVVMLWGCKLLTAAVPGSLSGGRCALCMAAACDVVAGRACQGMLDETG